MCNLPRVMALTRFCLFSLFQFLTRDAYEWFLERSLQIAEGGFKDAVHCGFPDCDYWAVVGADEPRPDCFMDCPKCGRSTCMKCNEIHGRELDCERLRLEVNNKNSKLNEITVQVHVHLLILWCFRSSPRAGRRSDF